MANIIEIEGLTYCYPDGTSALHDISLSVVEGARTVLLGPNGAGKSTLLLHLNGIYLAQQGKVGVLGRTVNKATEKWVRMQVGLVFQDPDDQGFSSTVWDDVAFGPINMGLHGEELAERVQQALQAVNMWAYKDKFPMHLSYGQKKRVAIAGVLAVKPPIIVLDEPVAFLDPQGKKALLDILGNLHVQGTTILIATHDVDLAAEWADALIVMKDGRTLVQGSTDLLTDAQLISAGELCFPLISRLFKNLPELALDKLPKNIDEAVAILKRVIK